MNPLMPIGSIGDDLVAPPSMPMASGASGQAGAPNFAAMAATALTQVNEQLQASQVDLQRVATGDVQNLHQVMIRMEESRISFQVLMQVRSRLLEAYQDVMRMQV